MHHHQHPALPPLPIVAPKPLYSHLHPPLPSSSPSSPPPPPPMLQNPHLRPSLARLDMPAPTRQPVMPSAIWPTNTPPVDDDDVYQRIGSITHPISNLARPGPSPPPRPLPTLPLDIPNSLKVRTKSPVGLLSRFPSTSVKTRPRPDAASHQQEAGFQPQQTMRPPKISTNNATNLNTGSNASTPTSTTTASNASNSLIRPLPPIPPALRSRKQSGSPGGGGATGASGSQSSSYNPGSTPVPVPISWATRPVDLNRGGGRGNAPSQGYNHQHLVQQQQHPHRSSSGAESASTHSLNTYSSSKSISLSRASSPSLLSSPGLSPPSSPRIRTGFAMHQVPPSPKQPHQHHGSGAGKTRMRSRSHSRPRNLGLGSGYGNLSDAVAGPSRLGPTSSTSSSGSGSMFASPDVMTEYGSVTAGFDAATTSTPVTAPAAMSTGANAAAAISIVARPIPQGSRSLPPKRRATASHASSPLHRPPSPPPQLAIITTTMGVGSRPVPLPPPPPPPPSIVTAVASASTQASSSSASSSSFLQPSQPLTLSHQQQRGPGVIQLPRDMVSRAAAIPPPLNSNCYNYVSASRGVLYVSDRDRKGKGKERERDETSIVGVTAHTVSSSVSILSTATAASAATSSSFSQRTFSDYSSSTSISGDTRLGHGTNVSLFNGFSDEEPLHSHPLSRELHGSDSTGDDGSGKQGDREDTEEQHVEGSKPYDDDAISCLSYIDPPEVTAAHLEDVSPGQSTGPYTPTQSFQLSSSLHVILPGLDSASGSAGADNAEEKPLIVYVDDNFASSPEGEELTRSVSPMRFGRLGSDGSIGASGESAEESDFFSDLDDPYKYNKRRSRWRGRTRTRVPVDTSTYPGEGKAKTSQRVRPSGSLGSMRELMKVGKRKGEGVKKNVQRPKSVGRYEPQRYHPLPVLPVRHERIGAGMDDPDATYTSPVSSSFGRSLSPIRYAKRSSAEVDFFDDGSSISPVSPVVRKSGGGGGGGGPGHRAKKTREQPWSYQFDYHAAKASSPFAFEMARGEIGGERERERRKEREEKMKNKNKRNGGGIASLVSEPAKKRVSIDVLDVSLLRSRGQPHMTVTEPAAGRVGGPGAELVLGIDGEEWNGSSSTLHGSTTSSTVGTNAHLRGTPGVSIATSGAKTTTRGRDRETVATVGGGVETAPTIPILRARTFKVRNP
ncbi:hypothetical protein AX15_006120 [Amanita polypyramis BW_CC]|nr:hypothetical protein AX15_006120 [Amanita polypyramis BW_CC]